jgi:hypothetical protein
VNQSKARTATAVPCRKGHPAFPCRYCGGTGVFKRIVCDFCAGHGGIDWDAYMEIWDLTQEYAKTIAQLQREAKQARREAKRYHAQMDHVVKDYLKSIEPEVAEIRRAEVELNPANARIAKARILPFRSAPRCLRLPDADDSQAFPGGEAA